MKIKAIIFDLDGTLIDSIPSHIKSFAMLFKMFGVKMPRKKIKKVLRATTEEIYEKLNAKKLLGIELEKFLELRRNIYYSIIRGKKTVFKDTMPTIKKLRRYKLGIATNSSRKTLLASTTSKLFNKFDATITFSEVYRAKPNPEMVLKLAKKLRAKPGECILVGDSTKDVRAAKNAGTVSIALYRKTGTSKFGELKKEKSSFIAKSALEIPKIIAKIEKAKQLL